MDSNQTKTDGKISTTQTRHDVMIYAVYLCLQGKKDYMGLAIKNDNLVYVYNLGGEDVEIPVSSKPVSQWPAVFNFIKVER